MRNKPHKRKSPVPSCFMCDICADRKSSKKLFSIRGCAHSYCSDCVRRYVISKIEDNVIRISCPVSDCYRSLKPEHCRSILPSEVFDRWQDKLREAAIPARHRFYCPYKTCSALMAKGPDFKDRVKMECPTCHKLFCTKCEVPWHSGTNCQKFRDLHEHDRKNEDIMFMQLAKEKEWTRCSKCKFYVERVDGCSHIKCRCRNNFCYKCGDNLGANGDHVCMKAQH